MAADAAPSVPSVEADTGALEQLPLNNGTVRHQIVE
jgi:hypothetical protein